MTANLIEKVFLPLIGNEILNELDDAALLHLNGLNLAFTTDSYVVSPIFFPGGDIGSLAVHGTINDLSMRGAKPLFLAATFIMEEGFAIDDLTKIVSSFNNACQEANVKLVAADTKVVDRGSADKLFITTTGIGVVDKLPAPAAGRAQPGDTIIVSGDIGRHGIAVMASRESLDLETAVLSDSCALDKVVQAVLMTTTDVHCLRDITRGGIAGVLNEIASASQVGVEIDEESIPLHSEVKAVCELLGLDPLYVACEGRMVCIVPSTAKDEVLRAMRGHACAEGAMAIGKIVSEHPGRVVMRSRVGGTRIVDKLSGEQLPRIC